MPLMIIELAGPIPFLLFMVQLCLRECVWEGGAFIQMKMIQTLYSSYYYFVVSLKKCDWNAHHENLYIWTSNNFGYVWAFKNVQCKSYSLDGGAEGDEPEAMNWFNHLNIYGKCQA